jgi:PAS domain S-box-containing protein
MSTQHADPVTARGAATPPGERTPAGAGAGSDPSLDTSAFRILAGAGRVLASSIEFDQTLSDVARMGLPALADACIVRVAADGAAPEMAVAHVDAAAEPVLATLAGTIATSPESPVAAALRQARSIVVPEIDHHVLRAMLGDAPPPDDVLALRIRSLIVVPLISRGDAFGTITFVATGSRRRYGDGDVPLVEELGRQASMAVENALLYAKEQHARQAAEAAVARLARLQAVTASLSRTVSVEEVGETIVSESMAAMGAAAGSLVLLESPGGDRPGAASDPGPDADPDAGAELVVVRSAGYSPELLGAFERFALGAGLPISAAVRTGSPVFLESLLERTARFPDLPAVPAGWVFGAWAALPLVVEGRSIGAIGLSFAGARVFDEEDRALMLAISQQCAQALERSRLFESAHRALVDAERAQRERAESLALLDSLLTSAPVGLAFWDRRLRYVRVNQALADFGGISPEAHVGRSLHEIVPSVAGELEPLLHEVLRTQEPRLNVEVSGTVPSEDGVRRDWLTSFYPVRESDGTLLGVGAVVAEITDRKRAEEDRERLYRDLRNFRATLDTTRDSVYIFDPVTLRFSYVNRGAIESTGFTREELLEMTPVDLKPEYDEARFRSVLAPLLAGTEASTTLTTVHRRRSGRTFPIEISLQYVQPPDDAGRVVAIVRDVTDRVEARARLQRLAQSERALNAELKAVIRAMNDAVLVADATGRVVLANPAAMTLFPEGPVQRFDDVLRRLEDPEHRAPRLGETAPQGPVELRVSGTVDRWLEMSAFPVLTPSDVVRDRAQPAEVLETIVFLRDITEPRRSRVAAEAFIGVLSHELRTPVTTIFGNSKLLGRAHRASGQPAQRELTADIEIEAERLYRLVEDLLVLAKYGQDAGKDLANEPILLQRVVPSVIRSEQPRWPATRFETLIPANLPAVQGDQTYVEQVVRNLLSNAAKYAGEGGSRVTVVLDANDVEASVRVLDEGPGFDDTDLDRLFELFYRSPRAMTTASGAGIGLFVCRRLVEAMGGRIWARPRPSGGAEFGFVLQLFFEEDL